MNSSPNGLEAFGMFTDSAHWVFNWVSKGQDMFGFGSFFLFMGVVLFGFDGGIGIGFAINGCWSIEIMDVLLGPGFGSLV